MEKEQKQEREKEKLKNQGEESWKSKTNLTNTFNSKRATRDNGEGNLNQKKNI